MEPVERLNQRHRLILRYGLAERGRGPDEIAEAIRAGLRQDEALELIDDDPLIDDPASISAACKDLMRMGFIRRSPFGYRTLAHDQPKLL